MKAKIRLRLRLGFVPRDPQILKTALSTNANWPKFQHLSPQENYGIAHVFGEEKELVFLLNCMVLKMCEKKRGLVCYSFKAMCNSVKKANSVSGIGLIRKTIA